VTSSESRYRRQTPADYRVEWATEKRGKSSLDGEADERQRDLAEGEALQ